MQHYVFADTLPGGGGRLGALGGSTGVCCEFLKYMVSHTRKYIGGILIMARLAARGKDLFVVKKKKSFDGSGGEIITRIETELRYQDNGNLLRRIRTFFKPGFLDKNKNFVSSGWQLEAKGIPMAATELLETLLEAGFTKTKPSKGDPT